VFTPTAGNGYATSTGTTSFTVEPLTPTTTGLGASPASPQLSGTSETLTATVNPSAATGTVQFKVGSTDIGSPVTVSAGGAHIVTATLPVGTDSLSAVFTAAAGNGYAGSTGSASFTVEPLTPTTTGLGASPPSPQLWGAVETLTATVGPSAATGTVQFEVGSTDIGSPVTVSAGSAHIETSSLPVGTDGLSAVFTPTAGNGYASSTGTTSFTVDPLDSTSTALTSSANPSQLGASVTFTATVAGAQGTGGTVSFADDGATIGACAAVAAGSGVATCATTFADPGTYTVSATFSGNAQSAGSSSALTQLVGRSGKGYWLVASDGGVFNYGDAGFFGSAGAVPLNKPIVGIAATPDGGGYWLVASDGGIFNYGDAGFFGSAGALPLNKPIVGIAATPDGGGYWLVASDGGVFSFGDATFDGSVPGQGIVSSVPIEGIIATPDGGGYWVVGQDGSLYTYGDATYLGSLVGLHLAAPIVGAAAGD
ncbi:MAG: Ig-like domain repeat protein, partial [Acidimicrobiales bacterium]